MNEGKIGNSKKIINRVLLHAENARKLRQGRGSLELNAFTRPLEMLAFGKCIPKIKCQTHLPLLKDL